MTKCQADQCGCELLCGQCQISLQSNEGCDRHCVKQQTQRHFLQTAYASNLPAFALAIDVARPQAKCFDFAKPIASFPRSNSNGCHQYGQLASTHQGLAKKLMPSGDEYTLNCSYPVRRANIRLCEPKALVQKLSRTLRGVLSFCRAYLTNLTVHYQDCLLSSAHQCQVFQSRVRSFGSPVGVL